MDEKLHILQHSLGLDQYGQHGGHRNYFVAGAGHSDYEHCQELVLAGLMTQTHGNSISGGDDVFMVTPAGKEWVAANSPKRPKMTASQLRYRSFLNAGGCLRFGEWLKSGGGASAA